MGIVKKNKRKIIVLNQEFYWWVKNEFDAYKGMLEINIATENKAFLIKYYAVQNQDTHRYITVLGKEFPGLQRKEENWQRFICPNFVPIFNNNGIGSKNIKLIIEWCFNPNKELIPVNYKGEILKNE